VILSIVAFGVGGGVYLWKESQAETAARSDFGPDASSSAKPGGKKKTGKKGGKGGTPRGGGKKARSGGGRPSGNGGGDGPSVNDPTPNPLGVPGSLPDPAPAPDDDDDDDDDDPAPAARRPPPFVGRGPAGPTYEAAMASSKQEVTIGSNSGPDLTNAQITGPMRNGSFVGECGAPDAMKVTVKVAIKNGRPAGVSVYAPDADIAGCVDRYVRTFSWPSSPKMDSFTTTY